METIINDEIKMQVLELFQGLESPVAILFFGSQENRGSCTETLQLVEEVAGLSELLSIKAFDLDTDSQTAAQYQVTNAPTLVIVPQDGEKTTDYGLRFVGPPAGHEFSSLIYDILYVSRRTTDLSHETRTYLNSLEKPVLLQVFVTPTCPYCPQAVLLAHQMAMESEMVQAEMVEATEFRDLADIFMVRSVPQTTINAGAGIVVGALPEAALLAKIQSTLT